ncbi:MAG TPA: sterol carrier protein domain-containing protein [Thermomicrobiales bacterium]|nr:sterol carrier protein domain-containing protein [Thermomicrobiales bacterium]
MSERSYYITFVYQLIDDYADWNNGVFTLSGQDGVLAVTPGGEPVATVTIQGLAALIWAGQDPADFIYRGWGDVDDTAAATLRALFPVAYPVLHEEF